MDPLKVLKKVVPQQHYFCQFSQILTKVMLLWNDFFLNFQWIHWSEMTLLYLNFEVWGVTDSAFSISGSNCSHTAVLCHFPCFFAQLSPPAIMGSFLKVGLQTNMDTAHWAVPITVPCQVKFEKGMRCRVGSRSGRYERTC